MNTFPVYSTPVWDEYEDRLLWAERLDSYQNYLMRFRRLFLSKNGLERADKYCKEDEYILTHTPAEINALFHIMCMNQVPIRTYSQTWKHMRELFADDENLLRFLHYEATH